MLKRWIRNVYSATAIEAKERELVSVVMQKREVTKFEEKLSQIPYAKGKYKNEQISDIVKIINNTLVITVHLASIETRLIAICSS